MYAPPQVRFGAESQVHGAPVRANIASNAAGSSTKKQRPSNIIGNREAGKNVPTHTKDQNRPKKSSSGLCVNIYHIPRSQSFIKCEYSNASRLDNLNQNVVEESAVIATNVEMSFPQIQGEQ